MLNRRMEDISLTGRHIAELRENINLCLIDKTVSQLAPLKAALEFFISHGLPQQMEFFPVEVEFAFWALHCCCYYLTLLCTFVKFCFSVYIPPVYLCKYTEKQVKFLIFLRVHS